MTKRVNMPTDISLDDILSAYDRKEISQRQLIGYIKSPSRAQLMNELMERTSSYPQTASFDERMYGILNDLSKPPLCPICQNNQKTFTGYVYRGYRETCNNRICINKQRSITASGKHIISEKRYERFRQWQSTIKSVDELNDEIIKKNIPYNKHLQHVYNSVIFEYLDNRYDDSYNREETLERIHMGEIAEHKPICDNPNCTNPVKWIGRKRALWHRYCCPSCSASSSETRMKAYTTCKEKAICGTSGAEEQLFIILKDKLGLKTIHHYESEEYPHNCDFYLPDYKLYIEYQGSQFHNRKPYTGSKEDLEFVEYCKENALRLNENSHRGSQYNSIIEVWTKTDPQKRADAKANNLNFLEIWKFTSIEDVIRQLDAYADSRGFKIEYNLNLTETED